MGLFKIERYKAKKEGAALFRIKTFAVLEMLRLPEYKILCLINSAMS